MSAGSPGRQLGAIILCVGLCISGLAVVGIAEQTDRDYRYYLSADLAPDATQYNELPEEAQTLTRRVVETGTATIEPARAEFFTAGGSRYLVGYEGRYYLLTADLQATDDGPVLEVSQPAFEHRPVYGYDSLSEQGQQILRTVLETDDWRATVDGSYAEFPPGGDAPTVGHGDYFVVREGEVYRLSVTQTQQALVLYVPAGLLGSLLVVYGAVRRWVR